MGVAPPLMHLRGLSLRFGTKVLFDGTDLTVSRGDRICLVGRNGTGKSTLLKVAAGAVVADSGERFVQPGTRIAYLAQDPDLSAFASVHDAVADGLVDPHETYLADAIIAELDLRPDAVPAALSGGEARARGDCPRAGRRSRHSAARRAHQPPRPADHRMAGRAAGGIFRRPRGDQP